jgi:hypothetical protein
VISQEKQREQIFGEWRRRSVTTASEAAVPAVLSTEVWNLSLASVLGLEMGLAPKYISDASGRDWIQVRRRRREDLFLPPSEPAVREPDIQSK